MHDNSKAPMVLMVGYSLKLQGGIPHVTKTLLNNLEYMDLHPCLHSYRPKHKAITSYLASFIPFIYKIFVNNNYGVVLLIVGSSGDAIRVLPYILLSKVRGLKICVQYHKSVDIIFSNISSRFVAYICNKALRSIDINCFLSNRLKIGFEDVISKGIPSRIIPNPLENMWIDTPVLSWNERTRDIVFFGRWSWEKGVDDLTICMERVKSKVKCEIYTDYVPSDTFKNCQIFPWVKETKVLEIMKTAKLLILPSYSEAYPTVLLEAAACGTPFLASNIAGIPDIAEQSGGGRLFEVGNINILAEMIDEIFADEDKWLEMSRSGKAWVNTLSVENVKKSWIDLINYLIRNK